MRYKNYFKLYIRNIKFTIQNTIIYRVHVEIYGSAETGEKNS